MKEIVLIAPNEELRVVAEDVINSNNLNVGLALGNLSNGVELAKKVEKSGTKILIARGGTYQEIKKAVNIPVVEIQVNAYDILRAFKNLKNYKGPIGMIGYENVVFGAEIISEILGLNIVTVNYSNEDEIPRKVYDLAINGIKEFVGDTIGIDIVKNMGIEGHLILSGKEAIYDATKEAYRILKITNEERTKTERFRIILDLMKEGIIAIDENGIITLFNSMAEKIFHIRKEEVLNKSISKLTVSKKMLNILEKGIEEIGEIQYIENGDVIASNHVPMIIDSKVVGTISSFQDITNIQKIERKFREDLNKKGLTAKYKFDNIIHDSLIMQENIHNAKMFSKYDTATVLIQGETGTGKELFAQSIHNESPRGNRPFVAINCAALPESLLESELFGYEDGAFTGAKKGGKMGLFELAHTGTIFLDEIGDMPISLQTRLLRVIQEKEVMRIGGDQVIPIDVRIIASTNKNLIDAVESNKFRADLYYRLNVLTLYIPPLRDRRGDILSLANIFLDKYSLELNKEINGIEEDARDLLLNLEYKGNVRELKGIIERAVVICSSNMITQGDLGVNDLGMHKVKEYYDFSSLTMKEIELHVIKEVLRKCNNNIKEAAKILDVDRTTIWRKKKIIENM
jgi:PAS domain S-box-containing protein